MGKGAASGYERSSEEETIIVGENEVDRQRKENRRRNRELMVIHSCLTSAALLLFSYFIQERQKYISLIFIILISYTVSKNVPVNIKSIALFLSTRSFHSCYLFFSKIKTGLPSLYSYKSDTCSI